ncbi:MAG: hypothetical protein V4500_08515 [Pseudomonadota bacterium]
MHRTDLPNEKENIQYSSQFYQNCLARLGDTGKSPAMVLDDTGKVLFCSQQAADILGNGIDDLLERPVKDFIPAVPFNPNAPGSNIVNAAYAGRQNQWREYGIFNNYGKRTFSVELLFDALEVDLHYLILLWVRIPTALFLRKNTHEHGTAQTLASPVQFLLEGAAMAEEPDIS